MEAPQYPVCPICEKEFYQEGDLESSFCHSCRESAQNRPISKKVLVFVIAIIAFSFVMLIKLPDTMKTAIAYEKGMDLTEKNYHVAALRHLKVAADKYPNSARVLSAYYESQINNLMLTEGQETLSKIIAIDDEPSATIADRVNAITDKVDAYYTMSEETEALIAANKNFETSKKIELLSAHFNESQDLMAAFMLSELYYEQQDFQAVVDLLEPLVKENSNWLIGYNNLIPALRELKSYDAAIDYSNQYIEQQLDNAFGYCVAARVEIGRQEYESALAFVQKAPYSDKDYYLNGLLAIAYSQTGDAEKGKVHYEVFNKTAEGDQLTIDFVNTHMKPAI